MTVMLLALLHYDDSVAGLTWMPFIVGCYTAVAGGSMMKNGVSQPSLATRECSKVLFGVVTFNTGSRGWVPGRCRLAVVENLRRSCLRLHTYGFTGTDLAYVANGILGEAVSVGCYVWYHAAGVVLVQAVGGIVTDLAGELWTTTASCVVNAAPGVHSQIFEILCGMSEPEDYQDVLG